MLENLGWIYYLLSRFEPIRGFAITAIVVMVVTLFAGIMIRGVTSDAYKESDREFGIGVFTKAKSFSKWIWIPILLVVLVPTKEDGMISVGLQAGGQAAVQAGAKLEELSQSELAGKIMSVVEAKVNKALDEAQRDNKPEK
jgi:hypothetical protein